MVGFPAILAGALNFLGAAVTQFHATSVARNLRSAEP